MKWDRKEERGNEKMKRRELTMTATFYTYLLQMRNIT
jgi:hypothetical protein